VANNNNNKPHNIYLFTNFMIRKLIWMSLTFELREKSEYLCFYYVASIICTTFFIFQKWWAG